MRLELRRCSSCGWRLGQTRQVAVYYLITYGKIGQRIVQMAGMKKDVRLLSIFQLHGILNQSYLRFKIRLLATDLSWSRINPLKLSKYCLVVKSLKPQSSGEAAALSASTSGICYTCKMKETVSRYTG